MESAVNLEVKDFKNDVIQQSAKIPVLVDFWASWCGPCKALDPIIRKLANEADGRWKLVKVDTEANQQLASEWGIKGIPNMKLFSNGEVIAEVAGALPEQQFRQWIEQHLPTEAKKLLLQAKKDVEEGLDSEAINKLRKVIDLDESLDDAKIMLAKLLLFDSLEESLILTTPFEKYHDEAGSIHLLSKLLSGNMPLPDSSLIENVNIAIDYLKDKQFEKSVTLLIDILAEDKHYADDLARRALIAIFSFLGEEHIVTKNNRRRFSMALY